MKYPLNIGKTILLAASFFALAACNHTNVATPSLQEPVARNTVQMVRLPHEIAPEEDHTDSLSRVSTLALSSFLGSIEAGYADVIMLDAPEASKGRIAAIENFINERGLIYGGMSALGAKPNTGSVMLYVERYIVSTPTCGEWLPETSNNSRNNDSAFHGCSNIANLGLMIANPRDLISGQNSGNSTAAAVRAIYTPAAKAATPSGPTITLSGLSGLTTGQTPPKK